MASFGDKLKALRLSRGLSQEELASILGTSKQVISRYENNQRSPKIDVVQEYAELLHVPIKYLSDNKIEFSDDFLQLPAMKEWRVLGATACGDPLYREFDDETVLAPANIDADFVFRCVGDSMIGARILDGDIVFVKSGGFVENGQIAVVRIGEEYTLKRIYRGDDYLELRAENPMYPPRIIRGEQENAEIIGKAVHFLSRVI